MDQCIFQSCTVAVQRTVVEAKIKLQARYIVNEILERLTQQVHVEKCCHVMSAGMLFSLH